MNESGGDVVVVGAGLIGLGIAFELAERGASVRVYDRGEPAHAASWAGAGMLAPYTEDVSDGPMLALCAQSLAEYPAFVERVRAAGGGDPGLRLSGIVHAAFGEPELERLRARARTLTARGITSEMLDRSGLLAAEPCLGPSAAGALLVHGEGYVDNRRLGRALEAACRARGVTMARTPVLGVECDERRVLGVRTEMGFTAARVVINACGAWAAKLPGVPRACIPRVEPVKGQMLALAIPVGLVRHPIWMPGAYFVPREDGRLLVGGTVERSGFDARVTALGIHELLHAALTGAPAIAGFTVTETWAGLRPGSSDGWPFLGATPLDGLLLATGHYRNGILLTPATARLIADMVQGQAAAELRPFALARLGEQAEAVIPARSSSS